MKTTPSNALVRVTFKRATAIPPVCLGSRGQAFECESAQTFRHL